MISLVKQLNVPKMSFLKKIFDPWYWEASLCKKHESHPGYKKDFEHKCMVCELDKLDNEIDDLKEKLEDAHEQHRKSCTIPHTCVKKLGDCLKCLKSYLDYYRTVEKHYYEER